MFQPAIGFHDYDPPAGPGAPYTFHREGGSPLVFAGPEADRIAALIDREKSLRPPPAPMASNDMLNPDGSLKEPGYGVAPRVTTDVAPRMVEVPANPVPMRPEEPVPAPSATAAPHQVSPGSGFVSANGAAEKIRGARVEYPGAMVDGVVQHPPSGAIAELPGRPGAEERAPSGLTLPTTVRDAGRNPSREDASAVPVRQELTVSRKGGTTDPEQRENLGRSFDTEQDAATAAAAAQMEINNAQAESARATAARAASLADDDQRKVEEAAAKRAQINAEYERKVAAIDKETAQAQTAADPNRLFRGQIGNQILSTLAIGLGTFGAALSGGPNFALDIINRKVDQDIQRQRDEITSGKTKRDNQLARFMRDHGMSLEDAENGLKVAWNNQIANQAMVVAGGQKSAEALAANEQIKARLAEESRKRLQAMYGAIQGEVETQTERSKFVVPRTGGSRALTLEEQVKNAELQARLAKAGYAVGHEGAAPPKATSNTSQGEIVPGLVRAAVATDAALSQLYKARAMLTDPKNGGITGRALDSASKLGADSAYMAEVKHAAQNIASMEAQGLAPDQKRVDELEHLLGSNNTDQALTHLDALIDAAQTKRETFKSVSAHTAKVGAISGGPEGEE